MIGAYAIPQEEMARGGATDLASPEYMRMVHRSILDELREFQEHGGKGSWNAGHLLGRMAPHMAREEEELVPVLTALLAAATPQAAPAAADIDRIARCLETGLDRLGEEHRAIRGPLAELRALAEEECDLWLYDLVGRLEFHLGTEENIYFPAIMLKGAYIVSSMEIAGMRSIDGGAMSANE